MTDNFRNCCDSTYAPLYLAGRETSIRLDVSTVGDGSTLHRIGQIQASDSHYTVMALTVNSFEWLMRRVVDSRTTGLSSDEYSPVCLSTLQTASSNT